MKKSRLMFTIMTTVCILMLAMPVFATEARASDQINRYMMNVTTSKNSIDVLVSVTGCGTVNKLGCESIVVYKASGSDWILTEALHEDNEGMSSKNTYTHVNTICCNGEKDVEYKVVVTIFAENDAGRDARTKTFYVTGK